MMVDLSRQEMTGKLYVFGVPVLSGLYAANAEDVRTWRSRVPTLLRWACRFSWFMTWTTKEEYRDATGAVRRLDTQPCPKCGRTRLAGGTHCGNNGAPCYGLRESLPQNA
jgi:hypothetical protein